MNNIARRIVTLMAKWLTAYVSVVAVLGEASTRAARLGQPRPDLSRSE